MVAFRPVAVMQIHGFLVNAISEDYQMIIRYDDSSFEKLTSTRSEYLQLNIGKWHERHLTDLSLLLLSLEAPTDTKLVSSQVYDDGVVQRLCISSHS